MKTLILIRQLIPHFVILNNELTPLGIIDFKKGTVYIFVIYFVNVKNFLKMFNFWAPVDWLCLYHMAIEH